MPDEVIFVLDGQTYSIDENEFEQKYQKFIDSLPYKNSGTLPKLYTEAYNKPFHIYKNNSGSVVVRPLTGDRTEMTIARKHFFDVVFNKANQNYKSYEPIILKGILEGQIIDHGKIDGNKKNGETVKLNNNIKNITFYGVPGVGKTHNIKKLINSIEAKLSTQEIFQTIQRNEKSNVELSEELQDRVKFVTFHQSFGYEDFIEGFRPNENGNIEIQEGIFKRICQEASENPERNFYLVIDEINRGNISKIFGELITLIEEDKRDKLEVTLPYSKEPFKVPRNLYIIGTMNTADKSIALIDVALRRRFTFVKMEPKADLIEDENAKKIFEELNIFLAKRLDEDHLIGHSYFMGINSDEDLQFILDYKIKPLLEEYFYGDKEGLNEAKNILEDTKRRSNDADNE